MIARILGIITCGLSLGGLYLFLHRPPHELQTVKPTGVIASYIYTPDELLGIDIYDEAVVHLYQEEGPPTVRVETDTCLIPFIDVQCKNKTVTIHHKQAHMIPKDSCKPLYYIVMPDIATITVHDSAKVIAPEPIKVDSLDITIRGNAQVAAVIETKELDVQARANSLLQLSGNTLEQYIELHGSSRYEAENLHSEECSIKASGASIAKISVTKNVHGSLLGSSNVTFWGDPEIFVTKNDISQLQKYSSPPSNHPTRE